MWPSRTRRLFESLVRAYSADLFRFAYWLTRDRTLAEDLVQEGYARAWRHMDQLQDEAGAKAWLFAIVRNEHARAHAKAGQTRGNESLDEVEDLADESFSLAGCFEVRSALHQLPESHREPLLLQVIGGFSCAEIGAMLSLTEANVMQRVSRARRALRELLEPETPLREQAL